MFQKLRARGTKFQVTIQINKDPDHPLPPLASIFSRISRIARIFCGPDNVQVDGQEDLHSVGARLKSRYLTSAAKSLLNS